MVVRHGTTAPVRGGLARGGVATTTWHSATTPRWGSITMLRQGRPTRDRAAMEAGTVRTAERRWIPVR
ncbi:hypothetical protein GUJ93_ZPchr0008g14028 [Zizania palustris]|uniref:Uncharacterized protein n=1 Tax=Zizania palustris TaxID=103762 RepID=A0A8J5RZW5_ZIZPA|nr:hypothetical protein GUJ93_ZPchr0008g14028 [Zizania palustris]